MPVLRPVTSVELLRPARNTAFFEGWNPLVDGSRTPLLCAELSRLAYASFDVVERTLLSIGFGGIQTLHNPRQNSPSLAGSEGFFAVHRTLDLTVAVFRGTEAGSFDDTLIDLLTLPVDWPGGGKVHSGFATGYLALRPRLHELLVDIPGRMLLTGHSLGGALANLAAVEFPQAELVTFGAPRVGDGRFVELLRDVSIRRFVNCCDLVTRVPPETFGERHVAEMLTSPLIFDASSLTVAEQNALIMARGTAGLAARWLATVLAGTGVAAEFVHAGDAQYIRHDGVIEPGIDEDSMRRDQIAGRSAYRDLVHQSMPALNPRRMYDRIEKLARLSMVGAGNAALLEFKGLFRDIVRSATLANVVLRDFADHAPSAYAQALR